MARHILEIQKEMWENFIAQLTEDYEQGRMSKYDYERKVDALLDDLFKIMKEIDTLNQNEQ
jgi:hypothetical protein